MDPSQGTPECERKFYVKGRQIDGDEDIFHEYKGHRNICQEELPMIVLSQGRRKAVSRNLCGFLNNGTGGIVYLGVDDHGEIAGMPLTTYQKDHVLLSVQDTLSRFHPPVDDTMYEVRTVPVLNEGESFNPEYSCTDDLVRRKTPHMLRTSRYCWCDKDAKAKFEMGIIAQSYVIEIEIFPWNPNNKLAVSSKTRVQPLFCNEEKLYFIRGLAGLHQPSIDEVIQMAESDAYNYYAKVTTEEKMPDLVQKQCPSSSHQA